MVKIEIESCLENMDNAPRKIHSHVSIPIVQYSRPPARNFPVSSMVVKKYPLTTFCTLENIQIFLFELLSKLKIFFREAVFFFTLLMPFHAKFNRSRKFLH